MVAWQDSSIRTNQLKREVEIPDDEVAHRGWEESASFLHLTGFVVGGIKIGNEPQRLAYE